MARHKGQFAFSANFEVKTAAALDPRMVVETKDELITKDTWPHDGDTLYLYKGLLVSVQAENAVYMLVEPSKALADDFSGWRRVDTDGTNSPDASIAEAIENLQTQLDALTSGNTSSAIESFNEIIAFLEGVQDTEDLGSIIAAIEQQIAGKQGTIEDLDTIRSGAQLGSTALQSVPAAYITDTELQEKGYAVASEVTTALAGKKSLAIVSQSSSEVALAQENTCYIITSGASGDVKVTAFAPPSAAMAEYTFMFAGAASLTLPDGVLWANGVAPTIDSAVHYELSVVGVTMQDGVVYKAVLTAFSVA